MDAPAAPATRRSPLKWLLPVLALAVSLGLSWGAYNLASYSWDQVVSYESPYTDLSPSAYVGDRALAEPIADAESRQVVLVVIDGLRDDASRTMQSISGLRARGADVRLTVVQPSLSYPTWTTIVTGAPPQISGVTTNWFEGPVAVETLFDVAEGSGRTVVVSGPTDLDTMFRAGEVSHASAFTDWVVGDYMSDDIVDDALLMDSEVGGADLLFVLLPDVDEAGHAFGGASAEYGDTVAKVDADLGRLIAGLGEERTYVVLPDHGHIDAGGHGGWEEPVIRTFAALAGPGVAQTTADARLQDVAPTVAVLAGMHAPSQAIGTAIDAVLADANGQARTVESVRAAGLTLSYVAAVNGAGAVTGIDAVGSPSELIAAQEQADAERLDAERDGRRWMSLAGAALLAAAVIAIGLLSWRALVAAIAGSVVYAAIYNALFFGAHGLRWSLSAFNEEDLIDAFFNQRMLEAALAGLAACVVAALIYAALRRAPKGPRSGFAAEWLALGGATVLLSQAVLAAQVGAFLGQWGATVTWILPDMQQAFKYDLDLIQLTALGAAAVIGPLLTLLIGRFHPKVRKAEAAA